MQNTPESKTSKSQPMMDYLKELKHILVTKPDSIPEGLSPYQIAAISGDEARMVLLMTKSDAAEHINQVTAKLGLTPLQLAVILNNLGIVRLIKTYFPFAIHAGLENGQSILHYSILFGTFEITKEFLTREFLCRINEKKQTPLIIAIGKNKTETVKAILDLGYPVGYTDTNNYDELAYAAISGNLEIFQLISERFKDKIYYKNYYIRPDQLNQASKCLNKFCYTPLGLAATFDNSPVVDALVPDYSSAIVNVLLPYYTNDEIEKVIVSLFMMNDSLKSHKPIFLILNKYFELPEKELSEFKQYCFKTIQTQGWTLATIESILTFGNSLRKKNPSTPKKLAEHKKTVKKEPVKKQSLKTNVEKQIIEIPDSPPRQLELLPELVFQETVASAPLDTPAPMVVNDPIIEEINRCNLGWVFEKLNLSKFSFDHPYAEAMEQRFLLAVANNEKEIASIFLGQNGFNQNKIGQKGWRPIHVALSFKHEAMAKYLLERGIDYSEEFLGRTILCSAAEKGFVSVVEELLPKADEVKNVAIVSRKKQNIDFDVVAGRALIDALKNGHSAVAMALIKAGADVNCKDRNNLTPLMYASRWGFAEVVDALMKQGANIESFDVEGCNALLHAIKIFAHCADELKKNTSYLADYDEALNAKLSATIARQLETIKRLFSYKPGLHEKNDKGEGIEQYIKQYPELNQIFEDCYPNIQKFELKGSKRPAEAGMDFFSDKRRLLGLTSQTKSSKPAANFNVSLKFYSAPGMYKGYKN
jgi:ankyrin repeat protein